MQAEGALKKIAFPPWSLVQELPPGSYLELLSQLSMTMNYNLQAKQTPYFPSCFGHGIHRRNSKQTGYLWVRS